MADFCKQCSIDNFDEDFGDLRNLSTEQNTKDGLYASVLCEGCGMTLVNHHGVCVSEHCIKAHGLKDT